MNIVGTWILDESDAQAYADLGNILVEFDEDGGMVYVIRGKESDKIIKLSYQIDGNTIITNQPSVSQIERTAFLLSNYRDLILEFGGVSYRFCRWEPGLASS